MPHKDPQKYKDWQAEYRKKNAQRLKEYSAMRYRRDLDFSRAQGRIFHRARKTEIRDRRLCRKYNLSVGEWDAIFEKQGRCCAACRTDEPGGKDQWHTDHDHDTGVVRGILCHQCNVALGQAGDSPLRLVQLFEYLENHAGLKRMLA